MGESEEEIWWRMHGRPHTMEEMEWYKLWYEFLQLSDKDKWSAEVREDFGDVSGEFEQWWPSHHYLFRQLSRFTIEEVITDNDFQVYKDDGSMPGEPGVIVLAVHLLESKAALRAAFEEILRKYHKGKAGRPEFDDWGDVYAFKSRPDSEMLKKILAVYRLHNAEQQKPRNKRMTLWEIEEEVSKTTPLIDKQGTKATLIWKKGPEYESHEESRKRSQYTTVKKYLGYADEILANVVVGKFPVYTVSKPVANIPPEAAGK